MSRFRRWLNREAKWYEFWRPSSGGAGGAIFALVIFFSLLALHTALKA